MGGFLLVVVLVVALYNIFAQVFRGTNPADLFRLNVNYIGPLSSSAPQSPKIEVKTKNNSTYIAKPSEISSQSQSDNKPKVQPPTGFTVEQLSPYYKKINISSLNVARYVNDIASFEFRTDWSINENESINVSGWYLKVNSGATIEIPRAISNYHPMRSTQEDIVMHRGSYVYVTSLSSPFGVNLRLNKCTGYLNDIYTFAPSLPNNCPGINRNEIITFKGECQSFILSLGGCEVPTSNEINFYASNDDQCRNFLNTLNYAGCYNRYSSDANFLSNEWRVWLGKSMPFDRAHDRVLLFDKQGLLVNEYVY